MIPDIDPDFIDDEKVQAKLRKDRAKAERARLREMAKLIGIDPEQVKAGGYNITEAEQLAERRQKGSSRKGKRRRRRKFNLPEKDMYAAVRMTEFWRIIDEELPELSRFIPYSFHRHRAYKPSTQNVWNRAEAFRRNRINGDTCPGCGGKPKKLSQWFIKRGRIPVCRGCHKLGCRFATAEQVSAWREAILADRGPFKLTSNDIRARRKRATLIAALGDPPICPFCGLSKPLPAEGIGRGWVTEPEPQCKSCLMKGLER